MIDACFDISQDMVTKLHEQMETLKVAEPVDELSDLSDSEDHTKYSKYTEDDDVSSDSSKLGIYTLYILSTLCYPILFANLACSNRQTESVVYERESCLTDTLDHPHCAVCPE